jgi:sec-independent protein translocase protein TatB
MRIVGRWMAKARAMADQFRKSFEEMSRQSELDELRAELDALRSERPLADLDRSLTAPVLPPPGASSASAQPESAEPRVQGAAPGAPE